MDVIWPGEGPLVCSQVLPSGRGCSKHEIDGLGFCFWHVPEADLEEAEQICGRTRCRHGHGTPEACHQVALEGTSPPRCKNHGANQGSVIAKHAAANRAEATVGDRLAEIMAEHGERMLNPRPLGNPLTELLKVADEMAAWKEVMRQVVAYLYSRERIRSAHSKVGEQLRAEVLLYERALERLAKVLQDIAKLGIEHKLAQIEDRQVKIVETALASALSASGLDIVAQEQARVVLRRELVRAAS